MDDKRHGSLDQYKEENAETEMLLETSLGRAFIRPIRTDRRCPPEFQGFRRLNQYTSSSLFQT